MEQAMTGPYIRSALHGRRPEAPNRPWLSTASRPGLRTEQHAAGSDWRVRENSRTRGRIDVWMNLSFCDLAIANVALGNNEQIFELPGDAVQERSPWVAFRSPCCQSRLLKGTSSQPMPRWRRR